MAQEATYYDSFFTNKVNPRKNQAPSHHLDRRELVFAKKQGDGGSKQGLQVDVNAYDRRIDKFQGKGIQEVSQESSAK